MASTAQLVYGPCSPLYWAPLRSYTGHSSQSSSARTTDAWIFSGDECSRLEDHFCDVIMNVGASLGSHPATGALATIYFRAISRMNGFSSLDPRLTAPACLALAGKAHGKELKADSLVSSFRHLLSPIRAPYGPSDVSVAESYVRSIISDLVEQDLPMPHALLAALLSMTPLSPPQPGAQPTNAAEAAPLGTSSSVGLCDNARQARMLAWGVLTDMFRTPLAASIYLRATLSSTAPPCFSITATDGATAAACLAAVALHMASVSVGSDASKIIRRLPAPPSLLLTLTAGLLALARSGSRRNVANDASVFVDAAARSETNAGAADAEAEEGVGGRAGLGADRGVVVGVAAEYLAARATAHVGTDEIAPSADMGPLGLVDMYILLDLLHISPITAILIAASAPSPAPGPNPVGLAGKHVSPNVQEVFDAVGTETVLLLARARGLLPSSVERAEKRN